LTGGGCGLQVKTSGEAYQSVTGRTQWLHQVVNVVFPPNCAGDVFRDGKNLHPGTPAQYSRDLTKSNILEGKRICSTVILRVTSDPAKEFLG